MDELIIEVERRSAAGKGASRKLRREGLIPAVVYGGGKEPVPVVVDRHVVTQLLRQEKGLNTVFLLKMKGTKQQRHAMLREAQIDPRTRQFRHMDFIRVVKGQQVKVDVPVVLDGEPAGVKLGGMMDWSARTLHVECALDAIPAAIHVDIAELGLGEHILVGDVSLPASVELLQDPNAVVVAISARGIKAAEEEEAEAALAADKESEPVVMRRGKGDEEESGG